MTSDIHQILVTQAVLGGLAAVGFAVAGYDSHAVWGALFGAAVTMANGVLMHWRLSRAANTDSDRMSQFHLMFGSLERFALAFGGLAVGIAALGLPAVPVIAGFAVTQMGFMIRGLIARS